MLMNFRTASSTPEVRGKKLAAIQKDLLNVLENGGVGRFAADTDLQWKVATLFRETVVDGFAMTDPTPIFTERRDARLGDKHEFTKLINTLRVVKYAPMSEPLIFTPRKAKYTISTSAYELPVGIDLQKILTRQHTVAEFADMSAQAITRHYVNLTLTAIDTACATGVTDLRGRSLRTAAASQDVAQVDLDGQLRRMYASNMDGLTVFAHRYALDPIFDFAANTDSANEELRARGVLGTYRGARLVSMQDEYNMWTQQFTTINAVDWEKLIFISSGNPGAILLERDLSALNWQDLDAERAWFRTGVRWDHGILVHSNWRYGVIELM